MLQAGLIIAGWDKVAGPSVWTIPMGGTLMQVCGADVVGGDYKLVWRPPCSPCGITKHPPWPSYAHFRHQASLTTPTPAQAVCDGFV
jgi:hypothetical protein